MLCVYFKIWWITFPWRWNSSPCVIILDVKENEDMLGAWLDRVEEDAEQPECDTTIDME